MGEIFFGQNLISNSFPTLYTFFLLTVDLFQDLHDYEEIFIPNDGTELPPDVAKKFSKLPISTLDPISQMVFKGLKSLNMLQSIVFNTAANSNENLLIAAPTGAGKTNVAMLTCLNIIRNSMSSTGVLNLKEFKNNSLCYFYKKTTEEAYRCD